MKSLLFALGTSLLLVCPRVCPSQVLGAMAAPQAALLGSSDIGMTLRGATEHQPGSSSYRLSGGGADVDGTNDAFRFSWARLQGDGSVAADVRIEAPVANARATGLLMFRQSLLPDAPFVDVAVRADGRVVLQYRATQGGVTKNVDMSENNLTHVRLVRAGSRFTAYAESGAGERSGSRTVSVNLTLAGASVYMGLGVCSRNSSVLQNVTFTDVTTTGTLY